MTDLRQSESKEDVAEDRTHSSMVSACNAVVRKPAISFGECVRAMGMESIVATSSGRTSLSGSPVGWREMQSVARCLMPGTCTIRNLYRSDFSFKFLRRG